MKDWTVEDEELLISNWEHNGLRTLAEMFDTTIKSIKGKARHLRLEGKYLPYKMKGWNGHEIRELKRLRAEKIPDEEISKILNRSPSAIVQRVTILRKQGYDIPNNKIRIEKYPRAGSRWTEEDTATFLATINVTGLESTADRLQRTPLAIAHRVRVHQAQHHMDPAIVEHAEAILEPFNKDDEDKGDDVK